MDGYMGDCTIITNNKQTINRTVIFQSEYIIWNNLYIFIACLTPMALQARKSYTYTQCAPPQ